MFRRFTNLATVHFIGIGGAGMSGIAEVLLDYDLEVSGCDQASSETTERLSKLGAKVYEGHSPEHVDNVDLVVISSAVSRDHPEVVAARQNNITVVRRAEMLGELMRLKYGIAVAGTHGKTTTTSLIGTVLTEAGLDPTVIVGGHDRSFLRLQPIVAVVTSVDEDHLDTYAGLDEIRSAFVTFASKVPFFGQAILCLDDTNIQGFLPQLKKEHRVVTYGVSPQADLRATEFESTASGSRFKVLDSRQGELGTVELPMPGLHNVRNSLAAIAVGQAMGIPFASIAQALAGFSGVHRRFETRGVWRGAKVIDDYAHHPTEVSATLEATRQAFPGAVIHVVFQPHLFSRTRHLALEFGRSLLGADTAVVTDIYASREQPEPGVTSDLVVEAARRRGHRHDRLCADWRQVPERLAAEVQEGDVILTLGAGDIYRLAELLVEEEAV